ncbi:MAG: tetratricopeptide repeat protein, partial [Alphaproteobacteria bacterium]|nr:tetratricopeptide repeat protein [Alphaproteobacteria bacterium]
TAEAVAACRRATRIEPKSARARSALGDALRGHGLLEDALAAYEAALALDPGHFAAQSMAARTLLDLGRIDEAVAAFRRAVALAPDQADTHSNLGNALREAGELDAALGAFAAAIARDPSYAPAHCNLGNVHQDRADWSAALACYDRALALDPGYVTALTNRGNALKQLGRFAEAVQSGTRALALSPANPTVLANLGMTHVAAGAFEPATGCFAQATALRHGAPWSAAERLAGTAAPPAPVPPPATAHFKLHHDAEQLRYLRDRGVVGEAFAPVIAAYEEVATELVGKAAPAAPLALSERQWRRLAPWYNRPIHVPPSPALANGAINPDHDAAALSAAYGDSRPNLVVLDDLLTAAALEALCAYCLEATIWYQVKHGYLGAYLVDGLGTPLVLQIADEMRRRLPGIFGKRRLNQLWAYKYDQRLPGIRMHADFAAVNVNFWVTPDGANRNPETGGLLVHRVPAPSDWAFRKYNYDVAAMEAFLAESAGAPIRIPYRQNRAIIFDSDLFHRTDDLDFRPGYENRRINVTMLFGDRGE